MRRDRKPDPTRTQIQNRSKQIREGWSVRTKQKRAMAKKLPPLTIPAYKVVPPKDSRDQLTLESID